jgi:hypothetical protein
MKAKINFGFAITLESLSLMPKKQIHLMDSGGELKNVCTSVRFGSVTKFRLMSQINHWILPGTLYVFDYPDV